MALLTTKSRQAQQHTIIQYIDRPVETIKEVIKYVEVPVDRIVIKEIQVIKEVPVEITKEVERVVDRVIEKPVHVIQEVEKFITKEIQVIKEVPNFIDRIVVQLKTPDHIKTIIIIQSIVIGVLFLGVCLKH